MFNIVVPSSSDKLSLQIYKDLLQPLCQEVSKLIAFPVRLINAACEKPGNLVRNREIKGPKLAALLARYLKDASPDTITIPDQSVAIPTLQGILISENDALLRDMCVKLLATAMCADTKNLVHPAYAETIKQCAADDVLLLNQILKSPAFPICKVCRITKMLDDDTVLLAIETGFLQPEALDNSGKLELTDGSMVHEELTSHLVHSPVLNLSQDKLLQCLENLSRLGIVNLNYKRMCPDLALYEPFQEFPEVLKIVAETPREKDYELALWAGTCELTSFGRSFAEICMPE